MGKLKLVNCVALVMAVFCTADVAFAGLGTPVTTVTGVSDTRAGIGLRFEFGDNTAQVVASVRHTYTNTDNNVTGALAEIAIPVFPNTNFAPKIRAMGLIGSTSVQGEAGVGYDFTNLQPLIGVGIQGPYVEAGANLLLSGELHPYIGANTFGNAPSADSSTIFISPLN